MIDTIEDSRMTGMSHLAVGPGRLLALLQVVGITTIGLRAALNLRNVWSVVGQRPHLVLSIMLAAAAWKQSDIAVALSALVPRGMNLVATPTQATTLEMGMRATGTRHPCGIVEEPGTTIITAETLATVTGHSESTGF